MITAGVAHSAGLKTTLTLEAEGVDTDSIITTAKSWSDVVKLDEYSYGKYICAIYADGTASASGSATYSIPSGVAAWSGIEQISAGENHVIGLKSDGTVVAVGDDTYGQTDVSGWSGITQVSAGKYHTLGLKSDGTVIATGQGTYGQTTVSGWTDITQVSAGAEISLGLKSDGSVVGIGSNDSNQRTVSGWSDITMVAAGNIHSLGLKTDGTVVAAGDGFYGETLVSGWANIVQVSSGALFSLGLQSDGTAVATGYDNSGTVNNVSSWAALFIPAEADSSTPSLVAAIGSTFALTLTGTADSTTDVILPLTNINARLRSGRSSYLQATLPYTSSIAAAVADRPNGDLNLVYVDADGSHAVTDVAMETIQISRGADNSSIVLTGHRQSTNAGPSSHTVTPLSLQTGTNSTTALVPGYNPLILPADDITAEGTTYTVDTVSLQASVSNIQTQLIGG